METRKTIAFFALILLAGWGVSCGGGSPEEARPADTPASTTLPKAAAQLNPTEGNNVKGSVTFEQQLDGGVHVTANLSGLPAGKHGFHIHETGDCSAPDASSAGGHFNPDASAHGGPDSPAHHAGDLGNLDAGDDGSAEYHATYNFVTLAEGPTSIIGKAVIVHAQADDFVTQPTGGAGARLACGVIEKK